MESRPLIGAEAFFFFESPHTGRAAGGREVVAVVAAAVAVGTRFCFLRCC